MGSGTYHQFRFHTFIFYVINFFQQYLGIDYNTIADNADWFSINDAGGDEVKLEDVSINNNGVAGIVSAMESHNVIGFSSKEVSDFSFAFVAPLGADNYGDFRKIGRHNVPAEELLQRRLKSQMLRK